jgi:tetratricopeptide (TPR) repeat protein
MIVVTSRGTPQDSAISQVTLHALDAPDVRAYLLNHPDAGADLREADVIEKLYERSDGLPAHIDRMLRALKVSSLECVLDAELEGVHPGQMTDTGIPKAIAQVVESLAVTSDSHTQRSMRLLKVLSVLPYGEPFEGIRRFLQTEPFYINNAVQLNEMGLLDVIPLSMSAPRLAAGSSAVAQPTVPKLLKVPRQVRDYVQSLLSEAEWREFMCAGADLFFGRRWRDGKIRPRVVPIEYRELLDHRPGNEFAVIHYLLQHSHISKDAPSARRAADLAVHYCSALRRDDRFRDLAIVAGGLLQVADAAMIPNRWSEIASLFGLALRMTGKREEAVNYLRRALTTPNIDIPRDVKASMLLNIALAEESLKHHTEAVVAADEVKRICDDQDSKFFQAHCIAESCRAEKDVRVLRLRELAKEANQRGFTTIANNLAIDLAREAKDSVEKTKLLDSVLSHRSDDLYNRTRAIAEKTKVASVAGKDDAFGLTDRLTLSEAYSYAHAQRFSSLFDTCHDGMWRLLEKAGDTQQLLRLFRHSSFIWRIRGEEVREAEYAEKLSSLKPPEETALPARQVIVEVRYFWKRLKVVLSGKASG